MTDSNHDAHVALANLRRASIISSLWVFVLLSMLFRDMHELAKKDYLEEILSRTVSDGLLLAAGILLAMPILMVPLSKLLPQVWSRRANLLVVLVFALSIITNPPGDLDDYWFAALELVGLVAIAWLAWTWRPQVTRAASE